MEVIFIRHTRVGVAPGTCYGWADVPVAESFNEEAAVTLNNLKSNMPFDAVFSSPLSRAVKLAEYCGYASPIVDDRLKEMNMGDWEMKKYDEIDDPHLQEWYDDYMHLPTTNGESFPDLYSRVAGFLDELRTKNYRRVAVFAHAGVLVCAGIYGGLFKEETAFENQVPYGGIEIIRI